ncbi:MAG: hypothetical protein KGI84_08830 [Elusimicrobia bacterium]|nr:hypothetical protein [Elusimicrobiota bacterium]
MSPDRRIVQLFSQEKLDEFRSMPAKARLQWLAQANALIRRVSGAKPRERPDSPGDAQRPLR